jgi:hypothetical protein
LNLGDLGVDLFEGGDYESGCLSGAVLGSSKDISTGEGDGDGFFLDRGWLLESGFEDAHQQISLKTEVFELEAFGIRNVLQRGFS